MGYKEEVFDRRVARHRNILPREAVGARTGIQGRAGPGSEQPHLGVGVPVPCRGVGLGAPSGFLPAQIIL